MSHQQANADRDRPVLVVGATGALGRKVVAALRQRGRRVRALVRPATDAAAIEGPGVEIVRGDLLDPASLDRALAGADAVITTAAGYTKRRKTDTDAIDTLGNQNLVAAARRAGTRRFVLTSILASDQTPDVPHFWHKKLAEDELRAQGVPFVALRPGAFLDQTVDFFADRVAKGRLVSFGDPAVPMTFVYTPDLARHLAEAVDLPAAADGHAIDIGWTRPVSMIDLQRIAAARTGRRIALTAVPWWLLRTLLTVIGLFSAMIRDVKAMLAFFQSGRYVADTTLQARWLDVPTPEDAIGRWLEAAGLAARGARRDDAARSATPAAPPAASR